MRNFVFFRFLFVKVLFFGRFALRRRVESLQKKKKGGKVVKFRNISILADDLLFTDLNRSTLQSTVQLAPPSHWARVPKSLKAPSIGCRMSYSLGTLLISSQLLYTQLWWTLISNYLTTLKLKLLFNSFIAFILKSKRLDFYFRFLFRVTCQLAVSLCYFPPLVTPTGWICNTVIPKFSLWTTLTFESTSYLILKKKNYLNCWLDSSLRIFLIELNLTKDLNKAILKESILDKIGGTEKQAYNSASNSSLRPPSNRHRALPGCKSTHTTKKKEGDLRTLCRNLLIARVMWHFSVDFPSRTCLALWAGKRPYYFYCSRLQVPGQYFPLFFCGLLCHRPPLTLSVISLAWNLHFMIYFSSAGHLSGIFRIFKKYYVWQFEFWNYSLIGVSRDLNPVIWINKWNNFLFLKNGIFSWTR